MFLIFLRWWFEMRSGQLITNIINCVILYHSVSGKTSWIYYLCCKQLRVQWVLKSNLSVLNAGTRLESSLMLLWSLDPPEPVLRSVIPDRRASTPAEKFLVRSSSWRSLLPAAGTVHLQGGSCRRRREHAKVATHWHVNPIPPPTSVNH